MLIQYIFQLILNLEKDLIVDCETHTENTEKGTELFYLIEDSITNYINN